MTRKQKIAECELGHIIAENLHFELGDTWEIHKSKTSPDKLLVVRVHAHTTPA